MPKAVLVRHIPSERIMERINKLSRQMYDEFPADFNAEDADFLSEGATRLDQKIRAWVRVLKGRQWL